MLIVVLFSVKWQSKSKGLISEVLMVFFYQLLAFELGFICALLCQSLVCLTVLRAISFEPKSKVYQFWLTGLIITSMKQ